MVWTCLDQWKFYFLDNIFKNKIQIRIIVILNNICYDLRIEPDDLAIVIPQFCNQRLGISKETNDQCNPKNEKPCFYISCMFLKIHFINFLAK